MTPRHEMPTPGAAALIAACFSALVPVLKTDRLVLRGPRIADFPVYADIVCSERGRFMGGPMHRDEAWADFIQLASCWMMYGHGGWTVERRNTGEVLGFVVLGLEPGDREVELGFMLAAPAEGRGYALEAATAVRNWAAADLDLTGVVSYIARGNDRSMRLAGRLGATRDAAAETILGDPDLHAFRHPVPESPT